MPKTIEFGLLLHTRHLIRDGQEPDFSSLWHQARFAEAAGYDHVWLGDSITTLNRARGDCLTIMAALAMATETIQIGTVPYLMSLRHPVVQAHALATIDVISKGRLRLGVSAARAAPYMNAQFEACGVPANEKAGRLSETIALTRRLWTEEKIDHDGKYFQLKDTGILPHPVQKPTIPIWIATGDEPTDIVLRRVARLSDGWVTTGRSVGQFTKWRAEIDDYARGYGRDPAEIAQSQLFAAFRIDEDGERARREGWDWMVNYMRRPKSDLEGTFTAIFGTAEECAAELRAYAGAGMTGVIARICSDDDETQARLLIDKVRPALG